MYFQARKAIINTAADMKMSGVNVWTSVNKQEKQTDIPGMGGGSSWELVINSVRINA